MNDLITLQERLTRVQLRIARAALVAGRLPDAVTLVAVSKTVAADRIQTAAAAGVTRIGENYIQEARQKFDQLHHLPLQWHFIGHLQSNKARQAVALFDLIHSVDSSHLAEALNAAAAKHSKVQPILIQVSLAGESSKSGLPPEAVLSLLQQAPAWPHLSIRGLMTMPPWDEDPEAARPYFRALRQLRDLLQPQAPEVVSLTQLSMGMSHDFEVAIAEGATLVRVGTALFGVRS